MRKDIVCNLFLREGLRLRFFDWKGEVGGEPREWLRFSPFRYQRIQHRIILSKIKQIRARAAAPEPSAVSQGAPSHSTLSPSSRGSGCVLSKFSSCEVKYLIEPYSAFSLIDSCYLIIVLSAPAFSPWPPRPEKA